MASNHTSHYDLNQWAASDKVLRAEFNADNAKVDAALAGLAGQVAGKASQTDLTALTVTVNSKANQSDLTALTNTVSTKANQADLTALTNTVNTKASQSALNTLTSTVNTKASQADLNTLRGDMVAGDRWVKLAQLTTTEDTLEFNLDVSQINFTDYWEIRLLLRCGYCGPLTVRLNHNSENNKYRQCLSSGTTNYADHLITFPADNTYPILARMTSHVVMPGQPASFFCYLTTGQGRTYQEQLCCHLNIPWEALTSFQFSAGMTIPAGAEVVVLGLKH